VSGRRQGLTSEADFATAIASMRRLNRAASEVFVRHGVTAATDVTGFGLLGHAAEMTRASAIAGAPIRFALDAATLPALPGALANARAGVETGGAAHNRRSTAGEVTIRSGVPADLEVLAFDPQTSGGLLAAVPAAVTTGVGTDLSAAGVDHAWIGLVEDGEGVVVR
jgi:selenide,water dikinase